MLIHHKFMAERPVGEMKFDFSQQEVCASLQSSSAEEQKRHMWDLIVRMHYLAHELKDPAVEFSGLSPEFTRLVSGLLREWAVMAEESVNADSGVGVLPIDKLLVDHH